jgi:hypothetical protein
VSETVSPGRETARQSWPSVSCLLRAEVILALAAFAMLCAAVLAVAPQLVEPDDFAYRASTVALTDGYPLTLSTAQVSALAAQLAQVGSGRVLAGPGTLGGGIEQWVQLPGGRWISEKDPGYPFLATPFQALGVIRLAPLFYGGLGCLGLFFGARRWLGRYGGAAAVGLFCSSGAALLFAWRDYMPTFTDASLIAAGTGALLWTLLADEATERRRTWTGLLGFVAIEAAVFARYTDIVVLGCAVLAVLAARWRRPASVPPGAAGWWLGSAAVFGAGLAVFNDLVYGGPLRSGYPPGEITFSLGAVGPNLRNMPPHLIQAMPMILLGLLALAWIAARWAAARRDGSQPGGSRYGRPASLDLAVGLTLAASWLSVWGLYAAYTWTTAPDLSSLQSVRFYLPAIGAISLLGAWLVTRLPLRPPLATVTVAAVVTAMFGLGIWSYTSMRTCPFTGICIRAARSQAVTPPASAGASDVIVVLLYLRVRKRLRNPAMAPEHRDFRSLADEVLDIAQHRFGDPSPAGVLSPAQRHHHALARLADLQHVDGPLPPELAEVDRLVGRGISVPGGPRPDRFTKERAERVLAQVVELRGRHTGPPQIAHDVDPHLLGCDRISVGEAVGADLLTSRRRHVLIEPGPIITGQHDRRLQSGVADRTAGPPAEPVRRHNEHSGGGSLLGRANGGGVRGEEDRRYRHVQPARERRRRAQDPA